MQTAEQKPNGPAALATTTPAHVPQTEALAKDQSSTIAAFASAGNFDAAQRMAKALACSNLVPEAYRNNLPNCLIAMELASRIGVSVFATMQNLDVIHGNPSLRSKFLIATVNSSGRFSPIRFRFQGKEGTDSWGCRAVAKDRESGEECVGTLVTIGIAKAEGWYAKNGSKWKTIPELMLSYRAAAFWARIYAPELSLGMQTAEEAHDIGDLRASDLPSGIKPGDTKDLEARLLSERTNAPDAAAEHDPETGVVDEPERMREPGED